MSGKASKKQQQQQAEEAPAPTVAAPKVPKAAKVKVAAKAPVTVDDAPVGVAAAAVQKAPRKAPHFHPGTVAVRTTKKQRQSVGHLLAKQPLERHVRQITKEQGYRLSSRIISKVRATAENYLTSYFGVLSLLAGVRETQTATAELGITAELIQKMQRGQPLMS